MNDNQFVRTEMLIGSLAMQKLHSSHVAVFGIGGVGSYAVEALARAGVGKITIFDDDCVNLSNINRQLIATHDTIGKSKVDVMQQRLLSINPNLVIFAQHCFYSPSNSSQFDLSIYDYVVDAIDTVTCKLELIECSAKSNTPIISCMGTGNKIQPTMLEVADIFDTTICPLARVMRHELRARNIDKLKVIYSKEVAKTPFNIDNLVQDTIDTISVVHKRQTPSSISFVPSVAGLIIASEVVQDLISEV